MRRSGRADGPSVSVLPLLASLLFGWAAPAPAQSIVTVAGGGTDDGGPAAAATLAYPRGTAVDAAGNVYIAEATSHRIRKVSARTGVITTVAGNGSESFSGDGGPATAAGLAWPQAVAVDGAGNLFVADTRNDRIRKVASGTGVITTVAGGGYGGSFAGDGGPATAARLYFPGGVAADTRGDIFIADSSNDRVRKVSAATGVITTIAGNGSEEDTGDGGPATAAGLYYPTGIAVDAAGNVYVSDQIHDRVRKVDGRTGVISAFAGNGTWTASGDGGPATTAGVSRPAGLALDTQGNLLIAESGSFRVRRVAAGTGIIATVAGNGSYAEQFSGDGGPATAAGLSAVEGVAADAWGNLFVADSQNNRVRRVDGSTGVITTLAGTGTRGFVGDGGPATTAGLSLPNGVGLDASGNLLVADSWNHRVRQVAAGSGTITTIAGTGAPVSSGDGGPATAAGLWFPSGIAVDASGNSFVAETFSHRIRKVAAGSGLISTFAGSGPTTSAYDGAFSGDGGPATAARLDNPNGLAVDAAGNVLVADTYNHRIRKVDAGTGLITTIAGSGPTGISSGSFGGDGGPATAASLNLPRGVAVDSSGDVLVADTGNYRVRKVAAGTGLIATVAGGGSGGDGSPATAADLGIVTGVAVDATGSVFVSSGNSRVRKVAAGTGILSTVAGSWAEGFTGDGGPATAAGIDLVTGLAVDADGDLFLAASGDNRVRAVFACRGQLGGFEPAYPRDGATASTNVLNLSWGRSGSAFRYDVLVDTAFPPRTVVKGDVLGETFQLSGLLPGTRYFWQVRAKGDPYCPPVERTTALRSLTTATPCLAPPAPLLAAPASPGATTALAWSAAAGAASYDLYLGAGQAPQLAAPGLTATSYTATGLPAGTVVRWRVVARASCNADLAASSTEGVFTVPGACAGLPAPALSSPADGAANVPPAALLAWQGVPGAASYDVYLGTADPPPLLASGVTGTSLRASLAAGQTVRWQVVARAACDAARTTPSPVRSFATTASCAAPATPSGLASTKGSARSGTTYALSWASSGDGVTYLVERSTSPGFASPEVVATAQPSLLLTAPAPGTWYHRVKGVSPCGSSSAPGAALAVEAVRGPAALSLLGPPRATIVPQPLPGQPLPRLEVTVRNGGASDFVGFFATSQPVPFFLMSETAISLRAGETRVFFLQLSGVPLDQAGRYEGILALVSADPADGVAYPQAAVSLAITDRKASDPVPAGLAPPVLLQGGQPVDTVRFLPAAVGSAPPDVLLDLANPGTAPLDLVADVLPDPWLSLQPGDGGTRAWNATAIPPGATRTVRLRAERMRGEAGGAFPRSTYVTFRTVDGQSSRLLVVDSDVVATGPCPGRSVLGPGERSLIVPSLVDAPAASGGVYVSKLLLTNLGPDAAQAELYYTPDTGEPGTSGSDCASVSYASVVVPGNDVVALNDPVGALFGLERSSGQLEVRSSRIGQLHVQSVVDAPDPGGGSFGFQLPAVPGGEGARAGVPYGVIGVVKDGTYRTNLILAETSGQQSSVTVTLYDTHGRALGSTRRELPPYGKKQLSVAELAGAATLAGGCLEIEAGPGSAGSVLGVLTVIDGRTNDASSFVARPLHASTTATTYAVPSVVRTSTFASRFEIRNNGPAPASYTVTYRGTTGTVTSAVRVLGPRVEDAFEDVLRDLFGLAAGTFGPLTVTSDSPDLSIVTRVYAETPSGSYGDSIEGLPLDDPGTTGASGRIVFVDGLEGTAGGDRSRGARTNLILTEVAGGTAALEISLWEKGQQRLAPLATQELALRPYELVQLNDVFASLGVGQTDHLGVLVMVRPAPGATGRVMALATRIDNRTNDTKNLALRP